MKLSMAYSPCPNDTFMFCDIAGGKLSLPDIQMDIHLHDVQTLNRLALTGTFDITKVSFHTYLLVKNTYHLLKVGSALGFGCGPLIVTKKDIKRKSLKNCKIAVPGELTTAHMLLKLWAPEADNKIFVHYDHVMDMVLNEEVDAGVIIHEGRFVYSDIGLKSLVDLGAWWEEETNLPIPLGCILARKTLNNDMIADFESLLKQAITNSLANTENTYSYIRKYAKEMDKVVLDKHINAFVNKFSLDIGEEGRKAVDMLEYMAREKGMIPY